MKPVRSLAKLASQLDAVHRPEQALAEKSQPLAVIMNRASGGFTVFSPDGDFDVLVDGRLACIGFTQAGRIKAGRINRIADPGLAAKELYWRAGGASGPAVNKNIGPGWTLDGGNTAYLHSKAGEGEAPAAAVFCCPSEGADISILPGQAYTFQACFGIHRTTGALRMTFKSETGETLRCVEAEVNNRKPGGRALSSYHPAHLTAEAPDDAATLTVEIVKNTTAEGEADSYLFFTRPALSRSEAIAFDYLHHDVPEEFLPAVLTLAGSELTRAEIPVPDLAMDGGRHSVSIRHRVTGKSASIPVFLPSTVSVTGQLYGLHESALVAQVNAANPVSLALWIDGRPADITVESEQGTGNVRVPLPPEACDARPHVFELRRTLTGQLIGQYAGMGPVSLLPWEALQKYAGMPLPTQLSPLAAYRMKSLASNLPVHGGMPRHDLHGILLEGFERPRRQFRILPFPQVAKPDVSIVIPVHNRFDVTYCCLAAILFAASRAAFEVIVVDDGSADTTTRLPEIAPGVVYLRNEKPLGFAGACNAGAARARGRYIFFLNNDTEPTAHFLDELIFAFENFGDVGIAGSKLVYPTGNLQEAGNVVWGSGDPWNYGRGGNAFDPRYTYTRLSDYVSGAALMIPKALWDEVGGFSPEFMPAYFEDTDLAYKVRNAGRKVVYVPHSVVVHYEGLSNGTDPASETGVKRFQEVNRPKFKMKWSSLFSGNGKMGENIDLEKDRGISRRVLFLDFEIPQLDRDAGSYAAIQEIRMVQAMGCKVTFLPLNLVYSGRHAEMLQRLGVETVYQPYCPGAATFLKERGREFDLVYVTRYAVAEQVIGLVREHAPQAKVAVNVADLHFLRQIRDAIATSSGERMAEALRTREAEIAALGKADLILSYSSVEQAVITSHITHGPKTGIVPWVIDTMPLKQPFADRQDLAFIGGFGHPPNVAAVKFFTTQVMPLLRGVLPKVRFLVYGSNVPPEIEALATGNVVIKGYIADVSEMLDNCRLFVAPLLTGAGMKGKVLDCLAAGIPSILSPVAAEGIGLRDGVDCVIARKPEEWVEAIVRLYNNERAWSAMSGAALALARKLYSFESGVAALAEAFASVEFFSPGEAALCVTSSRPEAPGHLPRATDGEFIPAVTGSGQ